jgi:glycosyltransferase involved in cell wall biosynthesis
MKFFFMSFDLISFLDNFKHSRTIGGAEKQQFLMINELMRRGNEILICTNFETVHDAGKKYRLWRYPGKRKYLKYLLLFWKLVCYRPDVVYLRSPSNIGIALLAYTLFFRKKMVFFSAHDTDFDPNVNLQNYNRKMFELFIKFTDHFFVQNMTQAAILKKEFGRDSSLFGNIISIKKLVGNLSISKKDYFLWVGRIEPFKRLELLLWITERLPKDQFVVVAPVNVRSEYSEELLARTKLGTNIQYIEFLRPDELDQCYQEARGLICTSEYEGFPNIFLEAWKNGTGVYTLGVDPNGVIQKSREKLGHVFSSAEKLVKNIHQVLDLQDQTYMYEYLIQNHSIKENVDVFLALISS